MKRKGRAYMAKPDLEKVYAGDKNSIISAMLCEASFYRMNGIVEAVKHGFKEPAIVRQIQNLTTDNTGTLTLTGGYTVSDFALAALHVLGIEAYGGNKENVRAIIDSKFGF